MRKFCSGLKIGDFADRHLADTVGSLRNDPAYDVAKLFLSTGVGYSLVGRSALEPARTPGRWTLNRPSDNVFQRFSDRGGLSGAQIVAMDERTHQNVLNYHTTASRVVLDEYVNLMHGQSSISVNSALVQLWFLMMRHGFSIAEKLFLEDASKSLVQLALLTLASSRGEAIIQQSIDNLNSDETTQGLKKLFRSDLCSGRPTESL